MKTLKGLQDIIRKIWTLLTRQQKLLAGVVLLSSLFAAIMETLGVSVILPLVNVLMSPEDLWDQKYIAYFAGIFHITDTVHLIGTVILGVTLVYIFKNVFFIFNGWLRLKYSYKVMREHSIKMMRAYVGRGYKFFLDNNVNVLLQGAGGDISGFYLSIAAFFQIILQFAVVLLIGAYMCITDWQLALTVMCCAMGCLFIILLVFKGKMTVSGERLRIYSIESNRILLETFHGIKDVLALKKQKYFEEEYEKALIKKQKYQLINGLGLEIPAYIIELVCITGIMGVLYFKSMQGSGGREYIATLATFAVGAFRIMPAIGKISSSANTIIGYVSYINSVYDNVMKMDDYNSSIRPKDAEDIVGGVDKDNFKTIRIDDIHYGYDPNNNMVLNGVDITIDRGSSVAIIGESGAGKSTLADIILGLLIPDSGSIRLDDCNIDLIPYSWSQMTGFVPQTIYLSDTTIKENIAFGINRDEIDDQRIIKAMKDADIYDFVMTLPDKENTMVGDRGVRLSGGQRQRIGIARALYHDPRILILDEATSALDNNTEDVVMDTINNLHGKMTLIIIAHRLTTIKNCERIYEIKDGKAVERKYSEL